MLSSKPYSGTGASKKALSSWIGRWGPPILCKSCCLSEHVFITYREVLSPKLLLGIGASKTILRGALLAVEDVPEVPAAVVANLGPQ